MNRYLEVYIVYCASLYSTKTFEFAFLVNLIVENKQFNSLIGLRNQKLTDNARHKNVAPPLDLTRTLKTCHKRNDGSKFLEN